MLESSGEFESFDTKSGLVHRPQGEEWLELLHFFVTLPGVHAAIDAFWREIPNSKFGQ